MTENTLNPEKTSVPADLPHNLMIEEMQALLRKFAEENAKNKSDVSEQNAQKPEAPQETTEDSAPEKDAKTEIAELKALVAQLVEEKARNSRDDDDEDECDGDDDFDGDYYWSPGPEWETLGYVAGGAALVGLGALLYHWLKD